MILIKIEFSIVGRVIKLLLVISTPVKYIAPPLKPQGEPSASRSLLRPKPIWVLSARAEPKEDPPPEPPDFIRPGINLEPKILVTGAHDRVDKLLNRSCVQWV